MRLQPNPRGNTVDGPFSCSSLWLRVKEDRIIRNLNHLKGWWTLISAYIWGISLFAIAWYDSWLMGTPQANIGEKWPSCPLVNKTWFMQTVIPSAMKYGTSLISRLWPICLEGTDHQGASHCRLTTVAFSIDRCSDQVDQDATGFIHALFNTECNQTSQ